MTNHQAASILVVDDVEPNRVVLGDFVTTLGHRPDFAANGLEALAAMRGRVPDLVLLDMVMPVMGGLELLERLRDDEGLRHVPVIVVSAQDEIDQVVRCIEAGAVDYLVKPFNPVLLRARLASSLERKAAADRERAYQAEIERKNRELIEQDRLKEKFFAIATHDLRSPLSSIRGYVSLLCDDLDRDDRREKCRGFVEKIGQVTNRALAIVSDFLDFKVIQCGGIRLVRMPQDVNNLLIESVEGHRSRIEEKRVSLAWDLADRLPRVELDRTRILQVLGNYLENAVKFSAPGSSITLRSLPAPGRVRIEVEDDGPGVHEGERALLFTEFPRISNRPTGGERSTGLGLCIVKQLVAIHGGSVGADFRGRGSTFWLELPVEPGPAAPGPAASGPR